MKKNAIENTVNEKQLKKLEAEKLKKQKAREAKKAKRLALIEKRKAKVEANKKKRAEKKAKKLARLDKIKAKKLLIKQKKQEARQKKLERLAKQKAKAKELKQKAKEKAKLQKQKETVQKPVQKKPEAQDTIDITVKLLKKYVKELAKNAVGIDDKKIKQLEKLGFTFTENSVSFTFEALSKNKRSVKPIEPEVEVDPADVEVVQTIDEAVDAAIGDKGDAIEALAAELENDDEKPATEVPVGDTFTDDATVVDDQPSDFDEDSEEIDDTYDDHRDEADDDKVDFRKDWNQEFDDDGERNENW